MIRGIGLALVSIALSHATAWAQTSPLATDKDGRIRTQIGRAHV